MIASFEKNPEKNGMPHSAAAAMNQHQAVHFIFE